MTAVIVTGAPRPRIFWEEQRRDVRTVYAGLKITSAVNLMEDRAYGQMERAERLSTLLREEQAFISGMRDVGLPIAFDLRIVSDPGRAVPLQIAVLARVWEGNPSDDGARSLQESVTGVIAQLRSSLPRHVTAEPVDDEAELRSFLQPFPAQTHVKSAVITKREVLGDPKRPDAKVGYYFSVLPLNWAENDWAQLYAMLAAGGERVVVSVGLIPTQLPAQFSDHLQRMATFYGRLARPDTLQGGLYFGQQTLPPDAFAVDAERIFSDYARRYVGNAFVFRIQVSSSGRAAPRGLVEMLGSLVSPSDTGGGSHLARERVTSAYEIRAPSTTDEELLARWNLEAIDFIGLPGRAEIWSRPDPPPAHLRALCVLADAKDASSAFRLPAAVDGMVPGFRVRKGQLGHSEAYQVQGTTVSIGGLSTTGQTLTLPLNSLTKHALFAGSTGSGKTTSVMELLRQLWIDHQIPFLVIEPVNSDADDYRKLKALAGFGQLEIVTIGDEDTAPLRFNPFAVPTGVLVGEHVANLLACFKAAFGLWEPLPGIYQDALNITYSRAGILTSEKAGDVERRWPTVVEFMKAMKEVTQDLGYAGEVKSNIEAASTRRAQQLVSGPAASSFLTDQSLDVRKLLDHPVVIELKSLGSGDEQSLMIALLLNAMTEHYQSVRGASPALVHVTVIEEAHRLLARPQGARSADQAQAKEKAAEAFAQTLAENRKYGEGIVIAEQIPTKLVEDAVKNTNLKVMHRLTAEEDREYLGRSMGMDEAQMQFTTRIQTGEALVYSDEYAEAAHVLVQRTITSPELIAPDPVSAPPFQACAPCRSKCSYRGAALAMVRDAKVLARLRGATTALRASGLSPAEVAAKWQNLTTMLRDEVTRYPALPSAEPGVTDAALCLFVHSQAIRNMQASPKWPIAVAKRLGIPVDPSDG